MVVKGAGQLLGEYRCVDGGPLEHRHDDFGQRVRARPRSGLEQTDPRKAQVVTLRYFARLTVEETAAALDLSPATVKNEWVFARVWLHRALGPAASDSSGEPT